MKPPTPSIGPALSPSNAPALAFKRVMSASIDRWLEEDITRTKKALAMDLGHTQADLSHWLSTSTRFTLPGHLVPAFCRLVGDNSLIWHISAMYEEGPGSDSRAS